MPKRSAESPSRPKHVRRMELEMRQRIDERDAAIREAIDEYLISHR